MIEHLPSVCAVASIAGHVEAEAQFEARNIKGGEAACAAVLARSSTHVKSPNTYPQSRPST